MVLLPGKDADAVALLPAVPEAAAEGNGGVAPEWPQVKCHSCPNIDKWKRMRSVKEVVHFQESLTDREDVVWWTYTCVPCVAREMNLTETEALAHVKQSMSTPAFCRKRVLFEVLCCWSPSFPGRIHRHTTGTLAFSLKCR